MFPLCFPYVSFLDADLGFTGVYVHAPSKLYLTRYRAYSPDLGRWLSRDPIGEQGGLNLYGYVGDNVINMVDEFGLAPLGHHTVPQSLYRDASDAVKQVFNDAKNRITDPKYTSHNGKLYNGVAECDYRKAVGDKLKDFLNKLGKNAVNQMNPQEAQEFADEIAAEGGEIGAYNAGVAAEMEAEIAAEAVAENEAMTLLEIILNLLGDD